MTDAQTPAIVVAAHSRPDALQRLLDSLRRANIETGTPLIISIDGGSPRQSQVRRVAAEMEADWGHGPFLIAEHEPLGLVGHFLRCGDLTERYGSVILLEDDLIVGPDFSHWAQAALSHAHGDDRIAGVSLATPYHDGYRHLPFEPVIDGSDGLFLQVPWYDGMAWTHEMWARYRHCVIDPATPIHRSFDELDDDEWFPNAVRYLVQTERFYLVPRHGHVTNSGVVGTHFESDTNYFQVPLSFRRPTQWRFSTLDDSLAVYDDHMELLPGVVLRLVPELSDYGIAQADLTVDLLGCRDLSTTTTSHLLTTRETTVAVQSWGSSLHPLIANLVAASPGDTIRLAKTEHVLSSTQSDRVSETTLREHGTRGNKMTNRDAISQLTTELQERVRRGLRR